MDSEPPPRIELRVAAPGWRRAVPSLARVCRTAIGRALVRGAPRPWLQGAEVSLLLADDRELRDLNRRFRGIDRPTDVLSFPAMPPAVLAGSAAPPGPVVLGDLAVALETVLAEAALLGVTPAAHLAHLLVHGTLHLLGHDHEEEEAAAAMEAIERAVLHELGLHDPYPQAAAGAEVVA